MRRSLTPAAVLLLAAACRRAPAPPPPLTPVTSGTIEIAGLAAPVRVVRDRWGVPHIFAASRADLYVAQGLVQAQDRLFQMDLWRRSAQGRLAEVLGANFIERDAMTRRLQYHGDPDADWTAHGPGTRAIAESFVTGVNAWVALARERPPDTFVLAGWLPDFWTAADLLNRTDAFDRRATLEMLARRGLPDAVVGAVRRAGAPPFFTGLAARVTAPPPRAEASRAPAASAEGDVERLDGPSPYYLVHLRAAGWDVIGATPPWRPGLAVAHDASTAWDRSDVSARVDLHVEPLDPDAGRTVQDTISVKGRAEAFAFETRITRGGVVIATDRTAGRQFALDWGGFAAGTAPAFSGRPSRPHPANGIGAADPAPGGERASVVFQHPLAITDAARARFNVGPIGRPPGNSPPFRITWNPRAWDQSQAINAPGQSEWPDSPHYSDLAAIWSAGGTVPLAYSDAAISANAEATLTLVPDRRR